MVNNTEVITMVTKRLDRIEQKLDDYSAKTTKALTCIENHMNNKSVHFTKAELLIKSEPKLTGKLVALSVGMLSLLTILVNGLFKLIGI